MKWLWILLLAGAALGQSHEILRPTVDVDGSSTVSNALDSADCSTATYTLSTSQPNWYDSGGLSTSSTFSLTDTLAGTGRCSSRTFSTWGTSVQSGYTSLTLNVNTSGSCTGQCGTGTISYSIDGGAHWTQIRQSGVPWAQTTDTVTLSASQDLTKLQVAANDFASPKNVTNGNFSITGFDVWTDGVYTPATPTPTPGPPPPVIAPPPVIISHLLDWLRAYLISSITWAL